MRPLCMHSRLKTPRRPQILFPLGGLLALALLATGCGQSAGPATEGGQRLGLVATGFLKGSIGVQTRHYSMGRTRALGGFPYLATRLGECLAQRQVSGGALLVDLGGNLSGSAESHASKGEIVVDCMNHLPIAASLLSNLEFTYGTQVLAQRAAQAHFPFLASNLGFRSPDLSRKIQREVSVQAGGLRVVLMGLAPSNLLSICAPEAVTGVMVDPGLARVLAHAARAKDTGADLVVVLSKIPVDNPPPEVKEAIAGSKVDILMGIAYEEAGEHVARWGRCVVAGLPGDDRGQRILTLDLSVARGTIQTAEAEAQIISPDTCPADPALQEALTQYEEKVMAPYHETLATARAPLSKAFRSESALGNLVTDAMRDATGAQVAVINNGALQDDLLAGEITRRDLFRVIPFDNALATVQVNGKTLYATFEQSLGRGSHFQVSGASYQARESAGGGAALEGLKVAGNAVDAQAIYTLALTDFILQHTAALHGTAGKPCGQLRETVERYLRRQKVPLEPRQEGRIAFERAPIASGAAHGP